MKQYNAAKWNLTLLPNDIFTPESVLENETHNILSDFEIQTDHLILTRRPVRVIINKKKELAFYWVLAFQRAKKGRF